MTIAELTATGWLLPRVDPAVGDDAKALTKLFRVLIETKAITSRHAEATSRLAEVQARASIENWDGYGGKPISQAVYEQAQAFLEALPTAAPTPDIVPEPDGEIAFEWEDGAGRVFSVSVGPSGILSYAGLFGDMARTHGTELFLGTPPQAVIEGIARLVRS